MKLIQNKPIGAILLCNLFLSLTAFFFQPLEHMLINLKDFQVSFENTWWILLLLSIGVTVLLSAIMMILPPKVGRIAAAISLGIGLAFLTQALLLNDGKPMRMDTNWPMEVLNVFVWIGIVVITVSMVAYFSREQGKKAEVVLHILTWVLIVAQAVNFMIITAAADAPVKGEEQSNSEQAEVLPDRQINPIQLSKNMVKISMHRGMPFYFKDYIKYDMDIVNLSSFKMKASASEESGLPETVDEGWELTQYPDASGNVGLFYSLYHPVDGKLILIDSGNPENADQVRSVINNHGRHVDAWFLTHYHGDHIGAFNALWEEYKDQIGMIYVNPLDWDTFVSIYRDWDTPEAFSGFLEETKGRSNVVTLYSGDELEIDGLKVKVFSSFDEHVRELTTDWPNDSSLVFKISATDESVLFMGDLSRAAVSLGQYIIDTYGADEVRADYIQAGHHGNWGQPISFYEQLMPKVIFQDGPEWLMIGEQYDAKDLAAWCAENGIITYDYRQAPTTVYLH